MDFVYWRHPTPVGIKVEEVSEGTYYKGATWREMAMQVYCENGREAYREIGHFQSGAPFLYNEAGRISVSHCPGLLVVATLPPTPEVDLGGYTDRAALGVDAERRDRKQVLAIRDRFLSPAELEMIPGDDVEANVLAWTVKEAAYKAALTQGIDFRTQIRIVRMPKFAPPTPVFDPADFGLAKDVKKIPEDFFGEVEIENGQSKVRFKVYSYLSDDVVVTICYHPKCAKFGAI